MDLVYAAGRYHGDAAREGVLSMAGFVETVRADQVRDGDVLSTDGYTVTWVCLLEGGGAPTEVSIVAAKGGHEKSAYLAPNTPIHLWRETA